jgi:1,4-dihydroxy-2-naphthoyl-CoA hydrolase
MSNSIRVVVIALTADGASVALQIHDNHLQPDAIVHGRLYCAIVESAASMSAQVWLDENGVGRVVGVNNNTDFLRAISSGTVTADSTPIHRGRRQQLWLVTVSDESGRVVARGQVRLQNLPPRAVG